MNQPWTPEIVISEDKAVQLIESQFSALKPVSSNILGEGFDNTVFFINNRYVFRFPRREIAAKLIQTENRLLPVLSPMMPLSIPYPHLQGGPVEDYPWQFSGYKILKGKTPSRLTMVQRGKSIEPLAEFLKSLHQFPVKEAERLQVPYDELDRMNIDKRKPLLKRNIEKANKFGLIEENVAEKVDSFLAVVQNPMGSPQKSLVHGDLHFRNILVDDNGKVSAIIDWGDSHIGHPAIDLSMAYSFLPPDGREQFFTIYGDVGIETKLMARFKAIYTAVILLLYAYDQSDKEFLNDSREALLLAIS